MKSLEDAFNHKKSLVFGLGGSGDIVGSIPTARLLELHDIDVLLGGVSWEPVPYDHQVGPRGFDEIENIEIVCPGFGKVSGETRTRDDLRFKESLVADYLSEDIALLDLTMGPRGLVDSMDRACDILDIDLVVGVDVGGDVLAKGDEPGLRSPVADSIGLIVLDEIRTDSCLGVFGYGSDGELNIAELESGIARAASRDGLLGAWGLTIKVREELEGLLDAVDTEASRLPVEAAMGNIGERSIRQEGITLDLKPPSSVTFYFAPRHVLSTSEPAELIREAQDYDEATNILRQADYVTESEIARRRVDSNHPLDESA